MSQIASAGRRGAHDVQRATRLASEQVAGDPAATVFRDGHLSPLAHEPFATVSLGLWLAITAIAFAGAPARLQYSSNLSKSS